MLQDADELSREPSRQENQPFLLGRADGLLNDCSCLYTKAAFVAYELSAAPIQAIIAEIPKSIRNDLTQELRL
jgi:hypothetical protein